MVHGLGANMRLVLSAELILTGRADKTTSVFVCVTVCVQYLLPVIERFRKLGMTAVTHLI